MSFYVFEFNVPAATPATAPVELVKEPMGGILKTVTVVIPNGHLGLARLRIETQDKPIMPSIGSDPPWIRGDGNQLTINPNLRMAGPPWYLRFFGYNDDAVNDHAFLIHVETE